MSGPTAPEDVLTEAAVFAGQAPSIHNSQPWRWRVRDNILDLMLERRRVLRTADPDARFATLSCGAALHHARIELATRGWHAAPERFPVDAEADCRARLRLGGRTAVDPIAARLVEAAACRRTDRRSAPSAPLDFDKLRTVAAAMRREGGDLRLLRPRQVFDLAEAVDRARYVQAEDPRWQVELAGWVGGDPSSGIGIPRVGLSADPPYGTAPEQDFRRPGGTVVVESQHHASVFAILHGAGDGPGDWLAAGEALSAGWLTATRLEVSVLPLSVVIEVASSRAMIQRMLGADFPYLVLRLAVASRDGDPARRTPRLPVEAVVERA